MIRDILLLGDPRLYQVSEPVTPEDKPFLEGWINDLHDTLMDYRRRFGAGRAIAAPQIGIGKRLLYMHIDEPVVFINPELIAQSEEMFEVWDDCMSFPELLVLIDRFKDCRIDYLDEDFKPQSLQLTGDLSELLQHEYDHLDGILATMRAKDQKSLKLHPQAPPKSRYRIGILGGISYTSSLVYYRELMEQYFAVKGDYYYPEIILHSLDFQRFTDYENHDPAKYLAYIAQSLTLLKQAQVDVALMAANSPHSVFDQVSAMGIVPLISLVEVVADEAERLGLSNLLLLGIKYTMNHTFYQTALAKRGITVITPNETEKNQVDAIIFGELAREYVRPQSKQWLLELIERYPVDGVILGCTELPLILGPNDSDIPLLNSIKLHCQAVIKHMFDQSSGQ